MKTTKRIKVGGEPSARDYCSLWDAAQTAKVGELQVWRWLRAGLVKGIQWEGKTGKLWVNRESLAEHLSKRAAAKKQAQS